jgi:hypothetical protein
MKRTFKQFIAEDNSTHYPWQAKSNEDLLKLPGWVKYDEERYDEPGGDVIVFLDDNTGEVYISGRIGEDGYFEIHDDWPKIINEMLVEHGGKWYIPFRLKEWKNESRSDDLKLVNLKISSFIGFPNKIKGSLVVNECPNLSIEGCPSIIGESVVWYNLPMSNNIDKVFQQVSGVIIAPSKYKGYLSFLKIKNLKSVKLSSLLPQNEFTIVSEACNIINEYLDSKNHNILACQEELIDNNLKDYAEL